MSDYDQIVQSASSFNELKVLSTQYISRQHDELNAQVERHRTEAEQNHVDAERSRAEAQWLRDVLKRLRSELEVRAVRMPRADSEDLRGIIARALRHGAPPNEVPLPAKAPTTDLQAAPADGNAAVMKRLRVRLEQVERTNKRLEKEGEHLKLELLVAQRDLKNVGVANSTSQGDLGRGKSFGSGPRSPRHSSPAPSTTSVRNAITSTASGREEKERRIEGERDQLLSMVTHLEKDQAEQQQYADQVVNELGHALKALEADNASLQEEQRQSDQKGNAQVEVRRKLERQVQQLKAENEALMQQVVGMPSEHTSDEKKALIRQVRTLRGKQASGDSLPPSAADRPRSTSNHKSEPYSTAAPEAPDLLPEPDASVASQLFVGASLENDSTLVARRPSLAWQPLNGDNSFSNPDTEDEDIAAVPDGVSSSASLPVANAIEGAPVAEPAEVKRSDEPASRPLGADAERTVPPTAVTTPAWASMMPDMLPRVSSPRHLVDIRARQGRTASPPKWPSGANGTSGSGGPSTKASAGHSGNSGGGRLARSSAAQSGKSSQIAAS